jgi:mannan polymerase II complex MNN11 subunit
MLTVPVPGYANFFTSISNYTRYTEPSPSSWTLIPALRHALTKYPHTAHFFSLSPHALIMSPSLSLREHVLDPDRLESLMQKDIPVVPPDSVIHTFSHLKSDKVDLILTQDAENLSHESFILRRGEWAKFFLDTWFNPLYRTYNFQKAEGHALVRLNYKTHPDIG